MEEGTCRTTKKGMRFCMTGKGVRFCKKAESEAECKARYKKLYQSK